MREKWKNVDKLRCPHCGSVRLTLDGPVKGKQRYFCKRCERTTIIPKGKKKKS